MSQDILRAVTLEDADVAVLTPVPTPVNPAGFPYPISILRIINASNQNVCIHYDGGPENDVVLANSVLQIYAQSVGQPDSQKAQFPQGMVVYVCNPVGPAGAGFVYVGGYYQK